MTLWCLCCVCISSEVYGEKSADVCIFQCCEEAENQLFWFPPARYRAPQTKSKKSKAETKLEFFGFEDKEEQDGDEGLESGMAGKSSYKIKYFGFDDLSESDSDDESSQAREKKAKKAAAALAALSSGVDSPHTSDSQDSQASSNTGEILHFLYSACRLLVHRLFSPSGADGTVRL